MLNINFVYFILFTSQFTSPEEFWLVKNCSQPFYRLGFWIPQLLWRLPPSSPKPTPPCAMVMRRDRCNHKFHHTPIAGVEPRAYHLSPTFVLGLGWNHNNVIHQSYHSPIQRWQFNHHGPMDALGITDGLIFNGKHLVFPSLPATEMCQVFTAPSGSWWNSQGNCSRSQACLQDRRN